MWHLHRAEVQCVVHNGTSEVLSHGTRHTHLHNYYTGSTKNHYVACTVKNTMAQGMPENRRTPRDALVTTAGYPNDQYERLEKLLLQCLMFILVYLGIFNIC